MNGVLQPGPCRYFPAAIRCDGSLSPRRVVRALVCIPLLAGEAAAFFDAGHSCTVWADAIVGDDTVCGEGFVGVGLVLGQEPADPPGATDQGVPLAAGHRRVPYSRNLAQAPMGAGAPALAGRP